MTIPKVQDLSEVPVGEGRVVEIDGEPAAVYRDESGGVHAVSRLRPRLCIVPLEPRREDLGLPLPRSRFGIDGGVLEGPAVNDLAPVGVRSPA